MIVQCDKCQFEYDDVYRLTYCPHDTFQMHCRVVVNGVEIIATTLEQLHAALKEPK